MNDLVSIIIPVYNAENYIERCLKSIIAQTYKNIEVIIINDGSTDKSKDICTEYAKNDSRIQLFSKLNSGVSSARNDGLMYAEGKYICFVDADDYVEPEFVMALSQGFDDENCMITACSMHISDTLPCGATDSWSLDFYTIEKAFYQMCKNNLVHPFVCNKMLVTQVIKDNNLKFDCSIMYGEDALFLLSYFACVYDKKLAYIPDCKLYNYILNSNSAMHKRRKKGFTPKWFDQITALKKASEYAQRLNLFDFSQSIKIRKCFIYSRILDLFVCTGSKNEPEYKQLLNTLRNELPQFLESDLFNDKVKRQMKICAKSPVIKYYLAKLKLI